jgi:replicative DNA helicase
LSVKSGENGLDLVIIDRIDMLRLNEAEERLDKASVLKKIARQLDVPIIVTSCIHRETGIQKRKDKTPKWSDLDADMFRHVDTIIFLHREYYYDLNADKNRLNIICPQGFPLGSAQLEWQPAFLSVEDISI